MRPLPASVIGARVKRGLIMLAYVVLSTSSCLACSSVTLVDGVPSDVW